MKQHEAGSANLWFLLFFMLGMLTGIFSDRAMHRVNSPGPALQSHAGLADQ